MRLDRNLEADISGIYQNKEGDTGNDVWENVRLGLF